MPKHLTPRALAVATERMLNAEDRGDYLDAIHWANIRDRILTKLHPPQPD